MMSPKQFFAILRGMDRSLYPQVDGDILTVTDGQRYQTWKLTKYPMTVELASLVVGYFNRQRDKRASSGVQQ
jgi:hypothetical protein